MSRQPLQVLVFEIEGQRYGLPASDVRELVRAVSIVPLPRAPAIIEGVINVRGRIVPVLDVRSRFRLPPRPLQPSDHFILARAGERMVALHVDRALELVQLETSDLEAAERVVPGVEYVAWVARQPHNLVLIHDPRSFLSSEESTTLDDATALAAVEPGEGR